MGAEHHKLMLNTESSFKARSQMGRENCRKADICPGRYSKTQGSHTVVTIKHCYSVFKRADLVLIRLHEMFLSPSFPHVSNEKGSVVRFLNIFRNSNYGLRLYSTGAAWKHIFLYLKVPMELFVNLRNIKGMFVFNEKGGFLF